MRLLYAAIMCLANALLQIVGRCLPESNRSKAALLMRGHIHLLKHIEQQMVALGDAPAHTYWVHCASLGEFGIARPIIAELRRRQPLCRIVLTFFSSTGIEAMKRRKAEADIVCYLPLDTPANAKRFIAAIKPTAAIFMVSELWCCHLHQLQQQGIPAYLISAIIRENSAALRPWGGLLRKALRSFRHISVLNYDSALRLAEIGITDHVSVTGDPLFDNAIAIANTPWSDTAIETFCAGQPTFIAGSIHDVNDVNLMARLANDHPDVKFIFVPHETDSRHIEQITSQLHFSTILHSQCASLPRNKIEHAQVLIIDFVGALPYLYRYASMAYVGGGFTKLLHSVIEATVYGLPVAFGPMIHRKVTPNQLIDLGIGKMVTQYDDLQLWFNDNFGNEHTSLSTCTIAQKYVAQNAGATKKITDIIEQ